MDNPLKPTNEEFQRAGLLAVLAQFATNPNVEIHTQLSIKQATMNVLNQHPVNDRVENIVRIKMR